MTRYSLTVNRVEPHPKAGQTVPRQFGGFQDNGVFPETMQRQVLLVELSEEEWNAVKRSVIEASK